MVSCTPVLFCLMKNNVKVSADVTSYEQTEMKLFGGLDTMALKQHFGKKIMELEDEKRAVQVTKDLFLYTYRQWEWNVCRVRDFHVLEQYYKPVSVWIIIPDKFFYAYILQKERDRLLVEVENLAANTDGQTQKMQDMHAQKLKMLEAQVLTQNEWADFLVFHMKLDVLL